MIYEKYIKPKGTETVEQQIRNICRLFDHMHGTLRPYVATSSTKPKEWSLDDLYCNLCNLIELATKLDPESHLDSAFKTQIYNALHVSITADERKSWGHYTEMRKTDQYYTTQRAEGAMAFAGDWSGIFLRGDDTMHQTHELDKAIRVFAHIMGEADDDGLYTKDPDTVLGEKDRSVLRFTLSSLRGLRSVLSGSNHHANAATRLNMKPFEECVMGEYFKQIDIWDACKPYKESEAVTSWLDYLGLTSSGGDHVLWVRK